MLAYYPLEHLYYLLSHSLIPSTVPSIKSVFSSNAKPTKLDPNAIGIWSTRFWAFYVFLQFAHLREDRKLLQARERAISKAKRGPGGTGISAAEKKELGDRWDAFWNEVVVNLGYLPLTVHWLVFCSQAPGIVAKCTPAFSGHWKKASLRMT